MPDPLAEFLRRFGDAGGVRDVRWHALFDTELGHLVAVHVERDLMQIQADELNAADVRAGGSGGMEVRSYALPELVAALCDATAERIRLAEAFGGVADARA